MDFKNAFDSNTFIITEGAVIERVRRESIFQLDPYIAHAGFTYEYDKKMALEKLYKQYIDITHAHKLPIIIFAPTWRANPERLKLAGLTNLNINSDCTNFLLNIRKEYGDYSKMIFIGGLIGCKGDAYNPGEALAADKSFDFHSFQVNALSNAGVDFFFAATLPALSEAIGIAKIMAVSGHDYILSFIIRSDGTLLDGNSLHNAIETIDSLALPKPLGYMVNCVHPTVFQSAVTNNVNSSNLVRERIIGFQGNTSAKSPEELNNSKELETEEPEHFAELMCKLYTTLGIKILGGCCGTNNLHIQSLVEKLLR